MAECGLRRLYRRSIVGMKGMLRAAEVLTLAAARSMEHPELIAKPREELLVKNGRKYRSRIM